MFVIIIVMSTAVVVLLPRAIPMGENVFFLASLIGFLLFFITVLATSKFKQPAKVVFTEFNNQTGWSDGMAFVLGVGSCMYAYLATDGATHIAEVSVPSQPSINRLILYRNSPTQAVMSLKPWDSPC